ELIFEADYFSLNSFGTKGYTHFKGVNLWRLLKEKAAISEDAVSVTIIATDGYQISFSLEQIQRQDYMDEQNPDNLYPIIISWEENGIEYDPSEGAPFKLAVGQKEAGDVNKPQWVSQIDRILVD
ncbi:MAG: molybdopterin-dependent oxidoreductase, partial [Vallitaleaceae bacterium]|nr:molybdopterin-dependent oxidoreductase [Vallitaleaceae bacterium]